MDVQDSPRGREGRVEPVRSEETMTSAASGGDPRISEPDTARGAIASADAPRLFGTDGVRDRFGGGMLTADRVARITGATVRALRDRSGFAEDFGGRDGRVVVVGRDTRRSGPELLDMVARPFLEHGYRVFDLGVLPTPGVALACRLREDALLGVVLSASHNPAEYNGIKFFAPTGAKISSEFERAVEREYAASDVEARGDAPGGELVSWAEEAREAYVEYLVGRCREPERLRGRAILLDTAHGATYEVAPEVFRRLGMNVRTIGDAPDGTNINRGVGALHPERCAAEIVALGASVGLCFDGDGDRMIPVTARGTILDGDYVLALAAKRLRSEGRLSRSTIVATVMSNVGLERALREMHLELLRTDVGDRNVYLEMVRGDHPVGGEQSGHTIFMDDAKTGDGILTGIRLLDVLESEDLDLERESRLMKRYPQVLKNVTVEEKRPFEDLPGVLDVVRDVETRLAGEGRVLLRYSGTEPLARVMVEGPDRATTERCCGEICRAIRRANR